MDSSEWGLQGLQFHGTSAQKGLSAPYANPIFRINSNELIEFHIDFLNISKTAQIYLAGYLSTFNLQLIV